MRTTIRRGVEWLSLVAILLTSSVSTMAVGAPAALATPSGLAFAKIKITGDEFVVLQNNSDKVVNDLSAYWLYNFNNVNPLTSGVSSSQQQLPAVPLDAGQTLLLSSTTRNTCGATIAGKLSISLTDSSGFLEIVKLGQDSAGSMTQTGGDVVSWSSTASGTIQNVPSSTKDPQGVNAYYRYKTSTGYSWQLAAIDTTNACQLNVVAGGVTTPVVAGSLADGDGTVPPATIVSIASNSDAVTDAPTLPAADIGLKPPVVNELLPNPLGTGNDATDEYIELYNPNAASFDLSGFTLQTGSTTKHNYVFPTDTMMPPQGFVAFYSSDTKLSLSNSGGQATLLDPFGTLLGQSTAYANAKDGSAWALANGNWYFTSQATPNAANVIKQAALSSSKTSKSKTSASGTATKNVSAAKTGVASVVNSSQQDTLTTPVHPWTLAIVIALALAYGLYEYRYDLANRLYEFRKHRANRSRTRYAMQGR